MMHGEAEQGERRDFAVTGYCPNPHSCIDSSLLFLEAVHREYEGRATF